MLMSLYGSVINNSFNGVYTGDFSTTIHIYLLNLTVFAKIGPNPICNEV